jgi:hypothetical protein
VRGLHADRRPRLGRDLVERGPGAGARGGRDRALDQRRFGKDDSDVVTLGRDHLGSHLGRDDRTSQVHQDQHAGRPSGTLDGRVHQLDVRTDRALGVRHSPGSLDRDVVPAHLPRQFDHAAGERRAVRDDDEADHRSARR